jgi:hypothetical protein
MQNETEAMLAASSKAVEVGLAKLFGLHIMTPLSLEL